MFTGAPTGREEDVGRPVFEARQFEVLTYLSTISRYQDTLNTDRDRGSQIAAGYQYHGNLCDPAHYLRAYIYERVQYIRSAVVRPSATMICATREPRDMVAPRGLFKSEYAK